MQHASWIGLLQLIPPDRHDSLVVVTTIGIEITLQAVCRIEPEYVVVRGRLAGTSDAGRVFILPYDHINYLGFIKEVTEAQLRELFHEPAVHSDAPGAEVPPEPAEGPATALNVEGGVTPPGSGSGQTPPLELGRPAIRSPLLGKTRLIERLRARALPGSPPKPPDK